MYSRLLTVPRRQSFFLFGPRGTGKTAWLTTALPGALFFDLLDTRIYTELLAAPERLGERIPGSFKNWVVLDEIQRIPDLLNEVHRLIESRHLRFALTGSSARKLRRKGVNLLAGRAVTRHMHPLTTLEIGDDFDLQRAVRWGCLPFAYTTDDPQDYLKSYVATYLREEVQQEGFVRNLGSFGRFLEAASFSQGAVLNISAVSRECGVNAKVVEDWFGILEDLLIAIRLPVFSRRARRKVVTHPKFYYFDSGVFQAIRPRGPLDTLEEIRGPALETLFLEQLRAINDYRGLGYSLHYWRTAAGAEVDFVAYGERGLHAFEVKSSARIRRDDLAALLQFRSDYPSATAWLVYPGTRRYHDSGVDVLPFGEALARLGEISRE